MKKKENDEDNSIYYLIKLPYIHEIELGIYTSTKLESGDWVLAETRYGLDLVRILGQGKAPQRDKESTRHVGVIQRIAEPADFEELNRNQKLEAQYEQICKSCIMQHKLDMKLIKVHVLYKKSKIVIFFTADQRVDFRALVKDLVSQLHTRIELRQIGVRDETRSLGGLAVCGREYCCHKINDQLKPASIKMVRDQELSLNSAKISGGCGRLLCCLSYEHESYTDARKELPAENSTVIWEKERYKVKEVHPLTKEISLVSYDDLATRPIRMSIDALAFDVQTSQWIDRASLASSNPEKARKKMVMTPCGCSRPEGTRCSGCSSRD